MLAIDLNPFDDVIDEVGGVIGGAAEATIGLAAQSLLGLIADSVASVTAGSNSSRYLGSMARHVGQS